MSTPWIAAFAALWLLVILLAVIVIGTLQRLLPLVAEAEATFGAAARALRTRGLPFGTVVPAFAAEAIDGAILTDSDLRGSTSVVLFLGSACPACEPLDSDLRAGFVPNLGVRLVVVSNDPEQARAFAEASDVVAIADAGRALAGIFESDRAPHAFVIDEHARVVANGSPNGWDRLHELVEQATKGGESQQKAAAAVTVS